MGIARTLIYVGEVSKPLYSLLPDGSVSDGTKDSEPSFLQEYQYKLKNLYCHFYTIRGKEMALERQQAAVLFYENILKEINASYKNGTRELKKIREDF